jgi:hypothetical protein
MKKRWYFIPAFLFIICFLSAMIIRPSFQHDESEINNYGFETVNSLSTVSQEFQTKDAQKIAQRLTAGSDLIVKGVYDGNRIITAKGFYTPVKITQVLKGNRTQVGQRINLLEEEEIFTYTKYINTCGRAYIPMQQGQEYLLLLKKVEFDSKRQLTSFEKSQYYPITQTAVGAYRISERKQMRVFDWDKKHESLNSLAGYDLPVQDSKELDFYYNIKDSVFQLLHVS